MIQNRYLVVQPIGKGGMGEVYLAVDQRLGSAVALKRTFFNEDEALGNAFEREARILGRLRHPVLPKVIDHFIENNDQFLVMEHISGDDLAKRLETANKPFPLSWVMFWADQMLDALNYLHSHEPPIVHRDIKPQNLKLTDDNHIVLLDFGLSKDFDTGASNSLNSASVAGYSPHFASMEQIRGTGTDGRSDLYSLSATLYQLLTNQAPADALSRADALLGGAKDPIVPLNEINPEVSSAISDVILKGVAIRQGERFETAVEMQKALRRAFNQGNSVAAANTVAFPATAEIASGLTSTHADVAAMKTQRPSMEAGISDETLKMASPLVEAEGRSEEKTALFSPDIADLPNETAIPEARTEDPPVTPVAAAAVATTAPPSTRVFAAPPATRSGPTRAPAPAPAPPIKAKSSSKAGLFVGGLIGFFLLVTAAGGAGWYAYNNYYLSAAPVSTPMPEPSVQPSPTPDAVEMADVSPDTDSNSATDVKGETNAGESSRSPTVADGPVATKPTQPLSVKAPPTRPLQPPTAKATPKPKQRDDRTVIEQ